jgi:transposase
VIAAELGLAQAMVYRWKAQDLIDRGVKPGTSTSERGELAAARQQIKELETELALVKQAAKLFEEGVRPKAEYPVIAELASQGFSAKRCCRIRAWPLRGSSCGGAGRPRHGSSGSPG